MRIHYSPTPHNEICIKDPKIEMVNLKDSIIKFLKSDDAIFKLPLDSSYDPTPYMQALKQLTIIKSVENRIETFNENCKMFGTNDFWQKFIDNLPYDVETVPYNTHFEWISFPGLISEDAPDIVIEACS